ncbi:MAG: glycerate kinase [Planctomycetota bacterium]|jgi:glycerate kinase
MRIVIAMDSFKGSLTAVQACEIVAQSLRSLVQEAEIVVKPMADGGEGTARAMIIAGNGQWIERTVTGPLPDMRTYAGFAWFEPEKMAVVEMAAASGLELLSPQQRNPIETTTYGTGQLISQAINHGAERLLLGVGGSATVDGGVGVAMAMGWKFLTAEGDEIGLGGGQLQRIDRIVAPTEPMKVTVQVLCDVDNRLCGEHGAARVYGPQKGATPEMVETLETGLSHLAELVKEQLVCDISSIPGAGAAGGLAAGAVAFMGARLVSGIETVTAWSRLDKRAAGADWVVTGEGCFDRQSLRGKVVSGVAKVAKKAGAKVAVLAGQVKLEPDEYSKIGVADAIGCMDDEIDLEYAMENGEKLLANAATKFAQKHLMPG